MKKALSAITQGLEEIATNLAAMETALIQRGLLDQGELDQYLFAEQVSGQHTFAEIRSLIASLDE